jgi:hypothetical protein
MNAVAPAFVLLLIFACVALLYKRIGARLCTLPEVSDTTKEHNSTGACLIIIIFTDVFHTLQATAVPVKPGFLDHYFLSMEPLH